jgi:hypothetical protein
VNPTRLAIPALAVALSVFGTSRLMAGIDPIRASAAADKVRTPGREPAAGGHGERAKGGDRGQRTTDREPRSFLSPPGMRQLRALLQSEAGRGGRVTLFRVQSDAAQVQVARGDRAGGTLLTIERGPSVRFRISTPVAAPGGFAPEELDAEAPQRIGTAIARLSDATLADVDYMVFLVSPIDRSGGWEAFLANADHTHFHADAHGRNVTRP